MLHLASSKYLSIGAECTPEDGVELQEASQLRLCGDDDEVGMANSFFKLVAVDKGEDDDEQSAAQVGSYYCLASAIKGRHDQIRVSSVRLDTYVGDGGVHARIVTNEEIEQVERLSQDVEKVYPRQQCHAYRMHEEDSINAEDMFRATRADKSYVNEARPPPPPARCLAMARYWL